MLQGVKGQGRDCEATFGMWVSSQKKEKSGWMDRRSVDDADCQVSNLSVEGFRCPKALQHSSASIFPFFFFFFRATCPHAPLCPLRLCTSLHTDFRYKGRDNNNNNNNQIEAVVFFCLRVCFRIQQIVKNACLR